MAFSFTEYARQALALADIPVDEIDLKIIAAAQRAYGAALEALDEADLSAVWPEVDLDPSRPPSKP